MAEMTPDKIAAIDEAEDRTRWDQQRISYYNSLRYNFEACSVDYWINKLFDQQKEIYRPQKGPSWNQIRKEAGVGFWENAKAFFFDDNEEIDKKKANAKKKLQEEVDEKNASERKRCNAYNTRLTERLNKKLKRLIAHDSEEVEEYFTYALNLDSFSLDGSEYPIDFNLIYDSEKMQLIVDYNLPTTADISKVKEWKVDKNNEILPKEMNKTDYLEMYERIIFDLYIRVIGIIFESDSNNLLKSIVFNGSCVYSNWQDLPTVLISFVISKGQYSYAKVRRMDYISKSAISKLQDVKYLDDIKSTKPPADLWETPPSKLVIPIRSSLGK